MDCSMGSGFISPNTEYQKNFTCHFFAIPPQRMILTHWPTEKKQQLLKDPLTLSKLQPLIPLSPKAAEYGINPDNWSEYLEVPIETCNPIVSVSFICNTDVKLIAKLSSIQQEIDDSTNSHEVAYQTLVYIYRKISHIKQGTSTVNIRAAVPHTGWYTLNIYASRNISTSNYEEVLSYQLQCNTDIGSQYKIGYPILYDMAAAAFDFQLLHWNKPMPDYCCEILSGKLDIAFHAKPELQFFHYIAEGKAENPVNANNIHHHNTLVAQNKSGDPHLHALRTVFPSLGWWTVYLCATKAVDSDSQQPTVSGYTTVFKYSVHVKNGNSKQSFPNITVPYVRLMYPEAIFASGNEMLTVPFHSLRVLEFCCYLTYETQTNELIENYATVAINNCTTLPEETRWKQHYDLRIIFPKPGKWFVHVYGRASTTTGTEKDTALFTLSVNVDSALSGKLFPTIYSSIATELNISCYESGCITFHDDGYPFIYKFQAPRHSIHLIPNIEFKGGNADIILDKKALQQCTLLSPTITDDSELSMYTMNAVFLSVGTWSVQLFGAHAESSSDIESYNLVMYIQLQVQNPTPNMCYPTIYPAFYDLGLSIPNELLLYNQVSEGSEVKFPFQSPEAMVFDTRLSQDSEVFINQAIVHYGSDTTGDFLQQRNLHIVFPKTGQWVIHVYAGSCSVVQNRPEDSNIEKMVVFELKIKALSCNDTYTFPQIFDPFHSKFSLKLDEERYPLISSIKRIPSIITIPFYSPPSVKFWHHATTPESDINPITRMHSDPQTGLHELSVEVAEHGQAIVIISALRSDSSDNQKQKWTTVLKHIIQA